MRHRQELVTGNDWEMTATVIIESMRWKSEKHFCEAMYISCRDQAPVEYVRGSLLLSTDGLPQWNPSTVHTWYVVQ